MSDMDKGDVSLAHVTPYRFLRAGMLTVPMDAYLDLL